jgi:ATP-binding cassette, subfamily B, bacterial
MRQDDRSTTTAAAAGDARGLAARSQPGGRGAALLLATLKLHRRDALVSLAAGVGWSLTRLGTPVFVRRAIDSGIGGGNAETLFEAVLCVLALGALGALFAGIRRYRAQALGARVETSLRARLFAHLLHLDAPFHARWSAGQLVSRAASDVSQIGQPIVNVPVSASNALMFLGAALVLSQIDALLALLALGPTLGIFVLTRVLAVRLTSRAKELQQSLGGVASTVEESIAGIRAIKGLGLERVSRERVDRETEHVHQAGLRMNAVRVLYAPLIDFLPAAGLVSVLYVGGLRVADGTLTVGALVQFYYYVVMMIGPLRMMGMTFAQLKRAVAAADLIAALLDSEPSVHEAPDLAATDEPAASQSKGPPELRFEAVDFAYPGREPLFRALDLRIAPGETVAIVGATGTGKSTLVSLLARLYDVSAGRVTLDGEDVRRLSLRALRTQLGLVFEDAFLFDGSLRENIAFGAPHAVQAEIERAARAAGAHDFIVALPEGYDARIGERGFQLSGGQRQRVALARALVREPRVLVLDAATSAVDANTEAGIRDALGSVLRGRTTILIAHRAATLRLADRVVLLSEGRVVDEGSHDALVERSALYRGILASGRESPRRSDDSAALRASA